VDSTLCYSSSQPRDHAYIAPITWQLCFDPAVCFDSSVECVSTWNALLDADLLTSKILLTTSKILVMLRISGYFQKSPLHPISLAAAFRLHFDQFAGRWLVDGI
jgi:hypothetical protein